ncbi:MAG: T9SS type A sorting domain-containing protein [Candidatus Cloacimonetes bacterium]|nr:T9SS type A sorting domain-containing protein [Candidatus Cloacimonadota bacterium]
MSSFYCLGMFGYTNGATFENLGITNINISGHNGVGGFIGISNNSIINNCYSTGYVNGHRSVGGFVGEIWECSNLYNNYSKMIVDGNYYVGGMVGLNNNSTMSNCYSMGSVSGIDDIGGLVGINWDTTTYSNCFWDIESSWQIGSAGGTGKTTAEMQNVATYTDLSTVGLDFPWDFVNNPFDDTGNENYWDIDGVNNDGYPFLTTTPLVEIYDEVVTKIPEVSKLLGNYPNPFNPTTKISFSIPEESKVELTVFNIKGQKVRYLAKEQYSKGNHSVIWNGEDDLGKLVSSGTYFFKLNVYGKTIAVKKCLLLK